VEVLLCDVGPRDGLQNEAAVLEPAVRAELARRLAGTGIPRVEVASFVNPTLVPQMAGAEEVVAALDAGAEWSGLVLNERGWERLAAAGLPRANLTLAATETFNLRNGNRTLEEAAAGAEAILRQADPGDGQPRTSSTPLTARASRAASTSMR
jgi:isopropylmalate/homocitrate/citramalate synthase